MTKVKSPMTVLRLASNLFTMENQQIFYPFIIIVFINLLILEVLYFAPRYPLSLFFNPLISRMWGAEYLQYPLNLLLLPKIMYYAQIVVFLFVTSILTAVTVDMIAAINNDRPAIFKDSFKRAIRSYISIVIYAMLPLIFFQGFTKGYGLLIRHADKIHETTGFYFWLKKFVFYATPYAQFIYGIFVTALLIYIPVLIIIEKRKIFTAFFVNFKVLFGSFWLTFFMILVPSLFFLPLLLMRENINALAQMTAPEIQIWIIALSIFISTAINIMTVSSASVYYLYKKENL